MGTYSAANENHVGYLKIFEIEKFMGKGWEAISERILKKEGPNTLITGLSVSGKNRFKYTGKPRIILNLHNKFGGEVSPLHRLPLEGREISEFNLQELIRNYPAILPIGEIDEVYADPISIGREVRVNDGDIDNMLISPSGYITLVETKLWRNPQARREVIAQIIDYAKDITKWSWDELNESFAAATDRVSESGDLCGRHRPARF